MASPCLSNGLFIGNHVHLDPTLFLELDNLARTKAGRPISIFPAEKETDFAYVSAWAVTQSRLTRSGWKFQRERGVISLANRIDFGQVADCKRPELDWTAIPVEDFYRFIILHEIAHVVAGDAMFLFDIQRRDDWLVGRQTFTLRELENGTARAPRVNPKYDGLLAALEMLADRVAWEALYHGRTLPKKPQFRMAPYELEIVLERFGEDRAKYQRKPPEPISTDPRQYVPYSHMNGIPWSPEVGATPLGQWEDGLSPNARSDHMAA